MFDKHKASKESSPAASEPRVAPPPPSASAAPAGSPDKVAMIGKGISIAGDVTADSNLRIEGVIEGRSVQSSHDVEIAESGRVVAGITAKVVKISGEVTGDIVTQDAVISGRVNGNIIAESRLELQSTCDIQGGIRSRRVQLDEGARFNGQVHMEDPSTSGVIKSAAKPTVGQPASPPNVALPPGQN